ncbi:MAG TPA: EF-hand domain-containing protein [Kofleriaceae bacterium]|nr:EF-hand domain-containing protein [Kofleriaceae bacterium]
MIRLLYWAYLATRSIALAFVIAGALCPAGRAEAKATAFALIVTNNHAGALGRPDLQYADDDGARYYELFAGLAPAAHLTLLTELDHDTSRLFPALVPIVQAPSRAHVAAAARSIAAEVAAAQRAGDRVELYFVFAGHGDVDHGRGFLQLSDGAFDADDLEALVRQIHADHTHVILDSCNSFFVANPRKPGGRRFATPADAGAGLAQRVANVGVFVSTSAEAEVFEWSALQSGVFSHAVRSGLAGAADADHDGVISYDELRAFVDTASAEIKNSTFRPKVYARGPGGDDHAALVTMAHRPRLELAAARPLRLTIRDRDEVPWIDVHQEAGAPLSLQLPAAAASVDELDDHDAIARHALRPGATSLADLAPAGPPPASRAGDAPFRGLFARPFGPHALAQYDAERASEPPPVFGIARDDASRLAQLLDTADAAQAEVRRISAGEQIAIGAGEIGVALLGDFSTETRGELIGLAVGLGALGVYRYVHRPDSERLRDALVHGLATSRDPARVVAEIDGKLHAAAHDAHKARMYQRWGGVILMAFAGGAYAANQLTDHRISHGDTVFNPLIATSAAIGALSFFTSLAETPLERTAELWDHEPSLAGAPRLVVAPVAGGAALSLVGRL